MLGVSRTPGIPSPSSSTTSFHLPKKRGQPPFPRLPYSSIAASPAPVPHSKSLGGCFEPMKQLGFAFATTTSHSERAR